MRTRFSFSNKLLLVGLPLLLLGPLLLVKQQRHRLLYPTSDVVVNPRTGEYSPTYAKYLLPLISEKDGVVSVKLGQSPGDSIEAASQYALSPVIRMHPEAREFKILWSVSYPSYNPSYELNYNRKTGIVTETKTSGLAPNTPTSKRLGRNIADKDIHDAVKNRMPLARWAAQYGKS